MAAADKASTVEETFERLHKGLERRQDMLEKLKVAKDMKRRLQISKRKLAALAATDNLRQACDGLDSASLPSIKGLLSSQATMLRAFIAALPPIKQLMNVSCKSLSVKCCRGSSTHTWASFNLTIDCSKIGWCCMCNFGWVWA